MEVPSLSMSVMVCGSSMLVLPPEYHTGGINSVDVLGWAGCTVIWACVQAMDAVLRAYRHHASAVDGRHPMHQVAA
eukprot:48462-Eustigmatos_ZCMA.PRE.1